MAKNLHSAFFGIKYIFILFCPAFLCINNRARICLASKSFRIRPKEEGAEDKARLKRLIDVATSFLRAYALLCLAVLQDKLNSATAGCGIWIMAELVESMAWQSYTV
jgi:hypothetical protein